MPSPPPIVTPPVVEKKEFQKTSPPIVTPPSPPASEKKEDGLKFVLIGVAILALAVVGAGLYFFIDSGKENGSDIKAVTEETVPQKEPDKTITTIPQRDSDNSIQKGSSPGTYKVKNTRAYFHTEADAATVRRAYLIEGDAIYVERISNGFGYVTYTNTAGTVTRGWLKMDDLDSV